MATAAAAAIPYIIAATSTAAAVMQGLSQQEMLEAQQAGFEDEKAYLAQQRVFLDEARDEELELFQQETTELLGMQEVTFEKAGIEMSGSAIKILNETHEEAVEEEGRIMRQYAQYRTMSEMKSAAADRQIGNIGSQLSSLPALTAVSALSSAASGFYTGSKMKSIFPTRKTWFKPPGG